MFRNYLITFYRNQLKHKAFSLITILGLAIGMASFLLIYSYVAYERSFDRFHKKDDNIYRVESKITHKGEVFRSSQNALACGPLMKKDFPEVEDFTRYHPIPGYGVVQYKDKSFFEERLFYADSSFLRIFSFEVIMGDGTNALRDPSCIVLTESMAKKYFGDDDPIGKSLMVLGKYANQRLRVTAITKDVPSNSHLQYNGLLSIHGFTHAPAFGNGWQNTTFQTYVQLHPDADPQKLAEQSYVFMERYIGSYMHVYNFDQEFTLRPLAGVHLYADVQGQLQEVRNGNYKVVHFVSLLALLILIIAWMNNINLSTAKLLERLKEVKLRMVVGATPMQLLQQMVLESAMVNGLAFLIAIGIIQWATPWFKEMMGLPEQVSTLSGAGFWLVFFGAFGLGMVANWLYFVLVVSSFKPANILQNLATFNTSKGANLRKGLLVMQLALSVFFIAGTLTVYRQISLIKNKDLGFEKDNVMIVRQPYVQGSGFKFIEARDTEQLTSKIAVFDEIVERHPDVQGITRSVYYPGDEYGQSVSVRREADDPAATMLIAQNMVKYNFFDVYKMKLLAGRSFSKEMQTDAYSTVINDASRRFFGFESPRDAIDQYLIWTFGSKSLRRRVIGVVQDFHQESLRKDIRPLVFVPRVEARVSSAIKLERTDSKVVGFIKEKWQEIFPGMPFDYHFLKGFIEGLYADEQKLSDVLRIFSFIAIFLTCFGLFALSLYASIQRTKEIAIRKVFGANSRGILGLVLMDFVKMLVIALAVALPITYFASYNWLQDFAYRIDIGPWFFLAPVITTATITIMTVLYHAIKIAKSNPAETLRYE